MAKPTGLLGLWVLIPDGDDGFSLAGRITLSIGDHHLIRINGPRPASRLMSSYALTAAETYFFDTEAELQAWLEWDPDGDKPRIVSMRKEPA